MNEEMYPDRVSTKPERENINPEKPPNRWLNALLATNAVTSVIGLIILFLLLVQNAFADARELVASLNINILNKIGNSITIDEVSLIVENHLEKTAKISGSSQTESSDFDSESDDEENHYQAAHDSMSSDLDSDQGIADSECFSNVSNCLFRGVRIYDNVKPSLFQSYFKVIVNGQTKFLHKQTACWLLMHDKSSLSSDRSRRVMNK
ncbi:unnamed protein product [Rotaria socialis]